jgi:hypothetical protein
VPPHGLRTVRRSGLYANCHASMRSQVTRQLQNDSHRPPISVNILEPDRCPECNSPVTVQQTRPTRRTPPAIRWSSEAPVKPP